MPESKQQPLKSPRGGDAHSFSRSMADWEAAAFDSAAHFTVVQMRQTDEEGNRLSAQFSVLPWAVRYARQRDDACLYAVTRSGRFALLDRVKWSEWEQRWWETRDD